jgi:hypothetical protein
MLYPPEPVCDWLGVFFGLFFSDPVTQHKQQVHQVYTTLRPFVNTKNKIRPGIDKTINVQYIVLTGGCVYGCNNVYQFKAKSQIVYGQGISGSRRVDYYPKKQ